jgi:pSer/pThr/pTyr-binding forkhead associated (FHA) protein
LKQPFFDGSEAMLKAKLIGCGVRQREVELTSDNLPLTFGRGPQAGIRVEDRWTSRRHCELHEVDGVLWVDDLGSTHGTHVNGSQTLHAALADGDTLHVGLSAFKVRYEPAAERVPQTVG